MLQGAQLRARPNKAATPPNSRPYGARLQQKQPPSSLSQQILSTSFLRLPSLLLPPKLFPPLPTPSQRLPLLEHPTQHPRERSPCPHASPGPTGQQLLGPGASQGLEADTEGFLRMRQARSSTSSITTSNGTCQRRGRRRGATLVSPLTGTT